MDGWQFRAEQRRDASISSSIPVLVISASHGREHQNGLEAECVGKPVDYEALLCAIERNAR